MNSEYVATFAAAAEAPEVESWQAGLQGHQQSEQPGTPPVSIAKRVDQHEFRMSPRQGRCQSGVIHAGTRRFHGQRVSFEIEHQARYLSSSREKKATSAHVDPAILARPFIDLPEPMMMQATNIPGGEAVPSMEMPDGPLLDCVERCRLRVVHIGDPDYSEAVAQHPAPRSRLKIGFRTN